MTRSATRRSARWIALRMAIFGALAISLGALLWLGPPSGAAQNNQDVRPLEPGKPIERELAGAQTHAYQITLAAGQFLHVVVEQRGIDVVATLFGPDGKQLFEVDSPNGTQGPEPVFIVAEAPGNYRLEVRSLEKDAAAGRYQVRIEELRAATAQDKTNIAAERALAEAKLLRAQRTAATSSQAIVKYEEALRLWQSTNNRARMAQTLVDLGSAHNDLSNREQEFNYYSQALRLYRELGDRSGEATALNNLGTSYSDLGKRQEAIDHFTQALPLFREVKDRGGEAYALVNIGVNYLYLGEKQKVLDYFNQALPLLQAIGNRHGESTVLNNLGGLYGSWGETQKALDYFNQALAIRRAIGNRAAEAQSLNNIGATYSEMGEKQKAIDHYQQAVPLLRAAGDRSVEGATLHNLGAAYQALGDLPKALDYLNQSLALLQAIKEPLGESEALNTLGSVYKDLNDLTQALSCYSRARQLKQALGDKKGTATLLRNVGALYDELGEYQKAIEYDQQALAIQQQINEPRAAAITLSNMGSTCREMDEVEAHRKARDYLRESLRIFEAIGDRENKAYVLGNLASVEMLLGENQKALDHLTQSLSFSQETGDRFGECISYAYLGDLYASLHEPQKSLDCYQRALKLSRDLKKKNIEAAALGHMAKLAYNRGQLKEAQTGIEQAIKVIESVRAGIAGRELRASYFNKVWEYYSFYIGVLMQLHQKHPTEGYAEAALEASERARARSLLELLTESRADIHQGIAPALLERERTIQQKLTARGVLYIRLPPGSEQAVRAAQEIEALNLERQSVESQIRATSVRYAALTQQITLAEIRRLLDSETLLLEYALGRDRGYLWVVNSIGPIKSYELPKRAQVEDAAKKLLAALTVVREAGVTPAQRKRNAELDTKTQAAAAELSRMLLAPAAAQLGKKRLVIVADGALQYVPFAALPKPGGAAQTRGARSRRSAGAQPLIIDHEIISLPSASTIAVLRRELAGRQTAPKVFAALADPVFNENEVDERLGEAARAAQRAAAQAKPSTILPSPQDRVLRTWLGAGAGDPEQRLRLPRLRESGKEATTIATFAPPGMSKVALGFEANHATATSPELGEYRHVLFATHGWLDDKHPELTGILLSLVDERKQEQNGLLRLGEVYNLKLQADLVTLSACQTALGKEIKGEGLVGLTRGFMYAGAARVAASLWQVEEEGTKELMIRFYRGMLKQRLRPAAALRQAQISMLRQPEWRSPYYWSAFILQGEWR